MDMACIGGEEGKEKETEEKAVQAEAEARAIREDKPLIGIQREC